MYKMLGNLKSVLFIAIAFGHFGCEGRREFPDLVETGVTLEDTDILLISGETKEVTARFVPNVVPQRTYTWEVADASVADLVVNEDQSVTITATGGGKTTLKIISQDGENLTAEAQLRVLPEPPVDITDLGTVNVNREGGGGPEGGEGSLKVVDGDLESKYLAEYKQPFWITLEFGEAPVINFYELTSGNDAPDRDPFDWQIQGSNDGETWEVLDERKGQTFEERNQTREFFFENDTPYLFYRFDVINNNGGGLFQMSEWRVLAVPKS